MNLYKSDLKKIGHTAYGDEWWLVNHDETEFLTVICYGKTANIEEILLREILALFGDYKIVQISEINGGDDMCDVQFITNFPWEEYKKL